MREKALGSTYEPYNMLSDSSLDNVLHLEAQFLHDWMHMIFVTGVWNLVFNFVLEAIRPEIAGNIYTLLYGYIAQWVWPKRVGGMKLHELFTETKRTANAKVGHFKCSASEGLSLYAVCAHFFATVVQRAGKCVVEIEAHSALCDVIDCLVATGKDLVESDTLLNAVETFLDKFDTAFGFDWSTPKCHWLLHFSDVHKT